MSDWPDKDRFGAPLNPERNGWHWLQEGDFPALAVRWFAADQKWEGGIVGHGAWRYLGPVLTPAEADALRAENARLREAVSFYRAMLVGKVRDGGAIARAALAGEVKP